MKFPPGLVALAQEFQDPPPAERPQAPSPASITLAQAIIETSTSAGGPFSSPLLLGGGNNLFGIKQAHDGRFQDGSQSKSTHEWDGTQMAPAVAAFAKYQTFRRCLQDRARILSLEYYAPLQAAKAVRAGDLERFAKCIGTWSTDPTYPDMLLDLVDKYGLRKYDTTTVVAQASTAAAPAVAGAPATLAAAPMEGDVFDDLYKSFQVTVDKQLILAKETARQYVRGGWLKVKAIAHDAAHKAELQAKDAASAEKLKEALDAAEQELENHIDWGKAPFLLRSALREGLHFALETLVEYSVTAAQFIAGENWGQKLDDQVQHIEWALEEKLGTDLGGDNVIGEPKK